VANRLQKLLSLRSSFVQFHQVLVLIIVVVDLLHLLVLSSPIADHIQTAPRIHVEHVVLQGTYIVFVQVLPLLVVTELRLSGDVVDILVVRETALFLLVNRVGCSTSTLEIPYHTSL